jgi:hypothetical protein
MRENGYQWCDTERYMIVDQFTGPEFTAAGYLLTKEQALEIVRNRPGWEDRLFIVRVDAIAAFRLEATGESGD